MVDMDNYIHKGTNQQGTLDIRGDALLCRACGTQYRVTKEEGLETCRICDDPRQFVPASGQSFTTLDELRYGSTKHKLVFKQDGPNVWAITVEPNVGIGQRALLIQTPHGNVLWDLVCHLDSEAVEKINSLGGLSLIIISHPHFYTTWADWSSTFGNIPVYIASIDQETHNLLLPGVTAIIAGGHFPGSMVLHIDKSTNGVPSLLHADTIHTVVNALSPDIDAKHFKAREDDPSKVDLSSGSGRGSTSYTFMWSIPNMIPLSPDQILKIWRALKGFDVEATYGFVTVRSKEGDTVSIPTRILESAKVCVRAMGWENHEIFAERV